MKNDNNLIKLAGNITKEFTFDHEAYGEKFYSSEISTLRKSGVADIFPILVSGILIDTNVTYLGAMVEMCGRIKSAHTVVNGKNTLNLYVFADSFTVDYEAYYQNEVILTGFIGKYPPVYRVTPLGSEIADFVLCVNRKTRKSDYIPCLCWGRNAKYAESFKTGYQIKSAGRLQSRNFLKDGVSRTAYEVSIGEIDVIDGYEKGEE